MKDLAVGVFKTCDRGLTQTNNITKICGVPIMCSNCCEMYSHYIAYCYILVVVHEKIYQKHAQKLHRPMVMHILMCFLHRRAIKI